MRNAPSEGKHQPTNNQLDTTGCLPEIPQQTQEQWTDKMAHFNAEDKPQTRHFLSTPRMLYAHNQTIDPNTSHFHCPPSIQVTANQTYTHRNTKVYVSKRSILHIKMLLEAI